MDNLDVEKFKKYFHYGLKYNQEEILDAIIISCAKKINKMDLEKIDVNNNRLEDTIDYIKSVYVQFERFINLTADNNKKWYKKVDKNTVSDVVMQRIKMLKKNDLISVVEYEPMYGIYTTDRTVFADDTRITGMQRYEGIQDWIKDDILPILMYLNQLEQENPYQYNSLFLDTKYARSINSNNLSNSEKIKSVYILFMESVKPAQEDIYMELGNDRTKENEKYIKRNYAKYWTITDLKEQAKSDKYMERIYHQCEDIRCKMEKDRLDD